MAALTLQEEKLCKTTKAWRRKWVQSPCFNPGQKGSFPIFLHIFNKNTLKQQPAGDAVKGAGIDVLVILNCEIFFALNSGYWSAQS